MIAHTQSVNKFNSNIGLIRSIVKGWSELALIDFTGEIERREFLFRTRWNLSKIGLQKTNIGRMWKKGCGKC
ncbi:MAG: hypothetical protein C4527_02060 [Candidatus Omnitrophota bacterium]|nr:MAG: hypothetical protein C4527_02060 [Candidatus Omnitrophota bacterium]